MPPKTSSVPHKRHFILQSPVDITASIWSFNVPRLPVISAPSKDGSLYIKFLSFIRHQRRAAVEGEPGSQRDAGSRANNKPADLEHDQLEIHFEKSEPCRVFTGKNLDNLLVISFADLRIENRQTEKFVIRVLESGITLNGKHYNFYGHSNSQLKSRTCYMYAARKEAIDHDINSMGDFSSMKNVAKLSKRIGLMFSSANSVLQLDPSRTADISDVTMNDYIFTDGCGLIAPKLAKELARRGRVVFRDRRYTPSVFQIRYRGYKGVVMVDNTMAADKNDSTLVKFRQSMRKFQGGTDLSFAVIGISKPYSFGRLNDEIILLIHGLGISSDILKQKQQSYFDMMSDALSDHIACFRFLSYKNETSLAERLLMDGLEAVKGQVQALINKEHNAHLNKRNEQRCRIFIEKSRLLYGVCDPYGVLRQGQCAVRITTLTEDGGSVRALANAEVLVTRNPCLHPGDCQKFMAVMRPELAHLTDCIVFPIKGKRPIADMLSGGDLDGDKFFVTWDEDIIPRAMSVPASYPAGKEKLQFGHLGVTERIEYFANYNNATLGRAKKLYLSWARIKGITSPECVQLNQLYSQSVDGAKVRIPEHLTTIPVEKKPSAGAREEENGTERFVLDILHEHAVQNIHQFRGLAATSESRNRAVGLGGLEYEDVCNFLMSLNETSIAYDQMELIQLLLRWCRSSSHDFGDFVDFFDFSEILHQEKLWLLQQLPPTFETESLVFNGLLQSHLVEPHQLRRFKLHYPGFRWKRFFGASVALEAGQDRMGEFMRNLRHAMEHFHRKFLLIKVNARLTVGVYIPSVVEPGEEVAVSDRVKIFAFTPVRDEHGVGPVVVPGKFDSKIIVEEGLFQLYENKRGNTFIFMSRSQRKPQPGVRGREAMRKALEEEARQGDAADWVISVALNKFNHALPTYMGKVQRHGIEAAEIYVISNLDRVGLRLLDLWLSQVDSDPSLKIKSFEDEALSYEIPKLEETDWDAYERGDVLRDLLIYNLELALGLAIGDANILRQAMEILLKCQEYRALDLMLQRIFKSGGTLSEQSINTISTIYDQRPGLFVSLVRLLKDDDFEGGGTENLTNILSIWSKMLKWAVQSTRDAGDLVIKPFEKLLLRYREISFQDFVDIVEYIVLCCPDLELATTLFYMLDEYSTRFIIGRPLVIAYFVRNVIGAGLDFLEESLEEAKSSKKRRKPLIRLKATEKAYKFTTVIRVDQLVGIPRMGDKVTLKETGEPTSFGHLPRWSWKPVVLDALVVQYYNGKMTFHFLQLPPSHVESCSWVVESHIPFVTTKTLLDTICAFSSEQSETCLAYPLLMDSPTGSIPIGGVETADSEDPSLNLAAIETSGTPTYHEKLNNSQSEAVKNAMEHSVTLIWGPPGTGKTTTIAVLLHEYFLRFPRTRILVAAPTHNAVDNILERCVSLFPELDRQVVRVSTDVYKVSRSIQKYTCDAFVGKDLNEDNKKRKEAMQKIQDSRLIFTTCVGAGIGLLREVIFGIAVVDEASQMTEPTCLVPLVKLREEPGKVVLVGDHVQLQATVHPLANAHGYSMSMFERLFTSGKHPHIKRVMLDTQYRMHPEICQFSSREFYEGKLKTGVKKSERQLPPSAFPWPVKGEDLARTVFVNCDAPEDVGRQSKSNTEQVQICRSICKMLSTRRPDDASSSKISIVILTPYSRQLALLKSNIPDVPSSTIDSFQGKESDIVVYSTVRSNQYANLGFLTDHRRLNVVLTRSRLGLIIVGNRKTLLGEAASTLLEAEASNAVSENEGHELWKRLLEDMPLVSVEEHEVSKSTH